MDAFEHFKPIRNKLRSYDVLSVVKTASRKLREMEDRPIQEWRGWLPWQLLLVIKWAFEHGGQNEPQKAFNEEGLTRLVNNIKEFENKFPSPFLEHGDAGGVPRFLRTLAFQQFWLQGKIGSWSIARQSMLFCHLDERHPIHENFVRLHQLTPSDCLRLSFLIWSWLQRNSTNIAFHPSELFKNIACSRETISAYLKTVALPLEDVRSYLQNRKQAVRDPFLQTVEQSPLVRYPILRVGDLCLVYSRVLFEEMIQNLFYDDLKSTGGSALSEVFATLLEEYTAKDLSAAGIPYYAERDLRRSLPNKKITDFALPFEDCTVLVEVKAIELRPSVKVFPGREQMINELRQYVIKAAVQGFTLANEIRKGGVNLDFQCHSEFFLMVITYKDLFLGPGISLWNEFLRDAVQPELEKMGIESLLIPPEHIVVLSIEELDKLVGLLIEKAVTLPKILRDMTQRNADPATQLMSFGQHLYKHVTNTPKYPFLDDEFHQVATEAAGLIQE